MVLCAVACSLVLSAVAWADDTDHSERLGPAPDGASQFHVVQPGETLSEIAQQALPFGAVPILTVVNGLRDPDRVSAGDQLLIPGPGYFLERYGIHLDPTQAYLTHRRSGAGTLILGIDFCRLEAVTGEQYCAERDFAVVELANDGGQQLLFQASTDDDRPGEYPSWSFVDLDGDGDVDLLKEWVMGTVNSTTQDVYHWAGGEFSSYGLVAEVSLGSVEYSTDEDGAMVFHYSPRATDGEPFDIEWQFLKRQRARRPVP